MKRFFLGFVCGVAMTFAVGYLLAPNPNGDDRVTRGLTKIENGETIPCKQIKIFQVLKPNMALADLTNAPEKSYDRDELLVLIIGDEKDSFYEKQKINVTNGKVVKRVGTYTYPTKESRKTVPAVKIQ